MMKDPSRVRVAGPLEPYARGFCAELARQGYARSSAVEQLKLVAHLSRWMSGESLSAGELTPERVKQFAAARRAGGRRHFLSPQGLLPLRGYLVKLGVAGPAPQVVASPADMLVERYRAYLAGERGLAAGTVRYYERVARRFLSLTSSGEGLDVGGLTTGDVSRFVLDECRFRSAGSAKTVVMALRSLLGYLYVEGLTATALAGAVPAVAPWRSASLPRTLDAAGLARLLASCDRRRATGRRDFAILMLLARLGLRAGEVAALCLDDFDWRAGEMMVRGKGDRQELLPLPDDVGEAVASYLRRGRQRVHCRRLFLRVHAPTAGLSGDGVTNVVRAACRRAGLPVAGAHRLRHFAATETLRQGASLAEVGQLLRHRSSFSTQIYAKVDQAALRQVVRSWTGGAR